MRANPQTVTCNKCEAVLPAESFNTAQLVPCPACKSKLLVNVFPALYRTTAAGRTGDVLLVDSEASCFYHVTKKAIIACEGCGRFLCALCDLEFNDKHLCPQCLEAGKTKGKIKNLENHRTLYDSIALSLSILPMLIFYATFITAPIAIYMSIRYWNAPRSIITRTRWRFVAAIAFSGLQIMGWILVVVFLFKRWK